LSGCLPYIALALQFFTLPSDLQIKDRNKVYLFNQDSGFVQYHWNKRPPVQVTRQPTVQVTRQPTVQVTRQYNKRKCDKQEEYHRISNIYGYL